MGRFLTRAARAQLQAAGKADTGRQLTSVHELPARNVAKIVAKHGMARAGVAHGSQRSEPSWELFFQKRMTTTTTTIVPYDRDIPAPCALNYYRGKTELFPMQPGNSCTDSVTHTHTREHGHARTWRLPPEALRRRM